MKAIVIRQPWAELIARGEKVLEVRRWRTSHRGEILIAAGKSPDYAAMVRRGMDGEEPGPTGVAVAIAELTATWEITIFDQKRAGLLDCELAEWMRPGAWAWELANVRRVEPVGVRGQRGIFDVDWPSARLRQGFGGLVRG